MLKLIKDTWLLNFTICLIMILNYCLFSLFMIEYVILRDVNIVPYIGIVTCELIIGIVFVNTNMNR